MYVWVLIMYYDAKDIEEGIAVEVEDNLKSRSAPAEKVRTVHVCIVCMYVCVYVCILLKFNLHRLATSRLWGNRFLTSPMHSSLRITAKMYSTTIIPLKLF